MQWLARRLIVGAVCTASSVVGPADRLLADDKSLECAPPVKLAGGMMMTCWHPGERDEPRDLLIHFHGAPAVVTERFARSGIDAVLVVWNFPGLSSVYAEPFREEPQLLQDTMNRALQQMRKSGAAGARTQWRRVCLSSFSAGYGAVREILSHRDDFDRIDGILAADSIYAGLAEEGSDRQVSEQNMRDFLHFARQAVNQRKTFLVTHSAQRTPYASTTETADYLLRALGMVREPSQRRDEDGLLRTSGASKGNFLVLGYAGDTAESHMQHLRRIDYWWKMLPLKSLSSLGREKGSGAFVGD